MIITEKQKAAAVAYAKEREANRPMTDLNVVRLTQVIVALNEDVECLIRENEMTTNMFRQGMERERKRMSELFRMFREGKMSEGDVLASVENGRLMREGKKDQNEK